MASSEASIDQLADIILNGKQLGETIEKALQGAPEALVAKVEEQLSGESVSLDDFDFNMQMAERGFESNGHTALAARVYELLAGETPIPSAELKSRSSAELEKQIRTVPTSRPSSRLGAALNLGQDADETSHLYQLGDRQVTN